MREREATARRYAKALFLLARESRRLEAVGAELARFLEVLAGDRRLGDALGRPWVKGAAKKSVATAVAQRLGCTKLVTDFLGLLAVRGRLDHGPEIQEAYQRLVDDAEGRVRARVRSAVALDARERGRLAAGLARVAGKEVVVEASVDQTLLGGFVAQIGSLVLDGSLDGRLARLRERVVRGSG